MSGRNSLLQHGLRHILSDALIGVGLSKSVLEQVQTCNPKPFRHQTSRLDSRNKLGLKPGLSQVRRLGPTFPLFLTLELGPGLDGINRLKTLRHFIVDDAKMNEIPDFSPTGNTQRLHCKEYT